MAANTGEEQPIRGAGRKFAPGQTGNPAGRPAGSRNKATLALDELLEGKAKAVTEKCLELAIAGDAVALRIAMDRILPVRRGRPVRFDLPAIEKPSDLVTALGGILQAVAVGDITPDEGATIAGVMDAKRRAHETQDLETRLAAIERATGGKA